jgi:plastocyanin
VRTALAGLVVLVTLVACSNSTASVNRRPHTGESTAADVNGVEEVTIQATDNFRFIPSTIYVHTGKTVKITLVKTGDQAPHDWQLTQFPSDFIPLLTAKGQTASTTFVAPAPGRYEFVCTIHVQAGQTGTLVVLP